MAGAAFWGLNDKGQSCAEGSLYAGDVWDTFIVAGMVLPGICELHGLGVASIDLIVKKAKGHTGAQVTFGGYDPKQFEVWCVIATPEQWEVFQDVCDALWRGQKAAPKDTDLALEVSHPDLDRMKINQAVLIGTPPGENGPFEGSKVFKLKFQEFVIPKKTKPVSATSAVTVVKSLRFNKGTEPSNAPPPAPSSNKKNLRLQGPPPQPPEGQ
jgi:hypothetical protein